MRGREHSKEWICSQHVKLEHVMCGLKYGSLLASMCGLKLEHVIERDQVRMCIEECNRFWLNT